MDLTNKIEEMKNAQNHLLLVIGHPGSGKSKLLRKYSKDTGIPILDLDCILKNTPPDYFLTEMEEFLSTYHQDVLLVDNKKILYQKNSSIDLLDFLQKLSQKIPVVASWNGLIEDGQIFHFNKDAPNDLIYSVEKEDFMYVLC